MVLVLQQDTSLFIASIHPRLLPDVRVDVVLLLLFENTAERYGCILPKELRKITGMITAQ